MLGWLNCIKIYAKFMTVGKLTIQNILIEDHCLFFSPLNEKRQSCYTRR